MKKSNSSSTTIDNANKGASMVLNLSMHAANQQTFAVGGIIVENKTGRVIKTMFNSVIKPLSDGTIFTWDPTAHGERQLVYWYYENKEKLNLPEPSELTVITSLDPCAMCTGALITAGFNVGVVAIDDYAGINFNEEFTFPSLPLHLREKAKQTFGYYAAGTKGIDPDMYVREYVGSGTVAFHRTKIESSNLMGCGAIFIDSANFVRETSSKNSGKPPEDLKNPKDLPENSAIKNAYRALYSNAFKFSTNNGRIPGKDIIKELDRVANNGQESNGSAVGFLDPFGNLILCMPDREKTAPVYTAFMEVVQAYSKTRWELMNNFRETANDHLTVPKYGTFLFYRAPDPFTAAGIMTLGAYGSTMEGSIPQVFPTNLQYVNPPKIGTIIQLTNVLINLPPFYTELVQLAVSPTLNHAAVAKKEPEFESVREEVEEILQEVKDHTSKVFRFRNAY